MFEAASPTSRRSLLTAGIGAGIGSVLALLGRSTPATAATGDALLLGNEYTASNMTAISLGEPADQTSTSAFRAASDTGLIGLEGTSTSGIGVKGFSGPGTGVRGVSTSGTGGSFESSTGFALRTTGRIGFTKAAGTATISAGTRSRLVAPGTNITSTTFVLATLQGSAGGSTTVQRVALNATDNTFRIYLTANATVSVKVGWLVLN